MMKSIQDIANLVTVRNFLASAIEDYRINLTREDVKKVQQKVSMFDKIIIDSAIAYDPNQTGVIISAISTEDTESVMKKILEAEKLEEKTEEPKPVKRKKAKDE